MVRSTFPGVFVLLSQKNLSRPCGFPSGASSPGRGGREGGREGEKKGFRLPLQQERGCREETGGAGEEGGSDSLLGAGSLGHGQMAVPEEDGDLVPSTQLPRAGRIVGFGGLGPLLLGLLRKEQLSVGSQAGEESAHPRAKAVGVKAQCWHPHVCLLSFPPALPHPASHLYPSLNCQLEFTPFLRHLCEAAPSHFPFSTLISIPCYASLDL